MKKEITKEETVQLLNNINGVTASDYEGLKFNYALGKNRGLLKDEYTAIMDTVKFTPEMLRFVKDWAGLSSQAMIEKVEAEKEKEGTNQELADKITAKIKANKTFLEEKIEVQLYEIKLETVPKNIKGMDYAGIELLIVEPVAPVAPVVPVVPDKPNKE